jgi:hypothetical protein
MDKSSSLGMPMHPKKYPRSTSVKVWGCPEAPPSSSAKIRSPFKTLYFYCFMHYVVFLERQLFLFLVFFCFVCCNKWLDHIMFLLEEMNSLFICQEHSSFHSYRSPGVLLFPLLLLVFVFALICVQIFLYLFIKVYFCLWSLLVFIKRGVYKKFKWCWKREKALCKKKVVQEGACVDCGLGFFMSCLMSF